MLALSGAMMAGCYEAHTLGSASTDTACEPTESLLIGCSSTIGTRCTGDPTLTVCDGTIPRASCTRGTTGFLGFNDDTEGLCPQLTVVCPPSGTFTVNPQPFGSRPFTCDWAARHGGVGP